MKKNVYPDWVEKYRSKGRTIRKVRDGYGLYSCTSVYVKGLAYPKSVQTYLGKITEKDGFIPKHSNNEHSEYLEYGLSHFIMVNFKRDLMRATYNSDIRIVLLGIVLFMFDSTSSVLIRSTYITKSYEDALISITSSDQGTKRVIGIKKKIDSLLRERIPDEEEKQILVHLLLLCVIEKNTAEESVAYPTAVTEILERNGLKI